MIKIVLYFVGVALCGVCAAQEMTDPCTDTAWITMIPSDVCGQFHACYDGRLYKTVNCSEGKALDPSRERCTAEAFSQCAQRKVEIFKCPDELQDGLYPNYSESCPTRTYFACNYGALEVRECPEGTFFDEGTDNCQAQGVQCTSATECRTDTDFAMYADYSDGCPPSKFIVCLAGSRMDSSCPEGLFYNEGMKNCDYPLNIPCSQNVKRLQAGK